MKQRLKSLYCRSYPTVDNRHVLTLAMQQELTGIRT